MVVEFLVLLAMGVFLFNFFRKPSPEICPNCGGDGKTYGRDYDEKRDVVYDTSYACHVCSGAGKVRFVKKEKGVKYYEPVWPKS